jgi:hypothetical protein
MRGGPYTVILVVEQINQESPQVAVEKSGLRWIEWLEMQLEKAHTQSVNPISTEGQELFIERPRGDCGKSR